MKAKNELLKAILKKLTFAYHNLKSKKYKQKTLDKIFNLKKNSNIYIKHLFCSKCRVSVKVNSDNRTDCLCKRLINSDRIQ